MKFITNKPIFFGFFAAVLVGCGTPQSTEQRSYAKPLPELNVRGASDAVAVVKDSDGRLRFTDSKVDVAKSDSQPAVPVAPLVQEAPKVVAAPLAPEVMKAAPAASVEVKADVVAADQEIEKALRAWIAAWSSKDFAGYMAAYSDRFSTPRFASKAQWEEFRKPRVEKPKTISISVSDLKIELQGANKARVTYRQAYTSDIFADNVLKRLDFVLEQGAWKIISER